MTVTVNIYWLLLCARLCLRAFLVFPFIVTSILMCLYSHFKMKLSKVRKGLSILPELNS